MENVSLNSFDNIGGSTRLGYNNDNNGSSLAQPVLLRRSLNATNTFHNTNTIYPIPVQTTLANNRASQSSIQSSMNAINYTNPTETISNPSQTQLLPELPDLPALPLQLNNYAYNNNNNNNNNNNMIQLPCNLNSMNGNNFNQSLSSTIATKPSWQTPITIQPSQMALSISTIPNIPITNTLPTSVLSSLSINANNTTANVQTKPCTELQYKINDNGTFQCLIINKKTHKICNKVFACGSSLVRHKHLVHNNDKVFKCQFKGCFLKSFARLHLLKSHIYRVHSYEKPFKCPDKYCDKSFKQRAHLVQHIRVHTDEKPYSCSFCGTKFRQKSAMVTHKHIHTGERPFKCEFCPKRFSHYTSFWRHKKNKICLKKRNNYF